MKKQILTHFLLACLTVHFSNAQVREVTLLYTNDIESVYDPIGAFWNDTISHIGGIAHLSTLIKQTRANEQLSFLFDAGDIFTGALSQATQGELPFDIYSAMGYDAMALGNHEFEYGWERLHQVQQRARFPVLNANIFHEKTDIPYCRAFTILEKDGIRVGVVAIMGLEAFKNTINPIHRAGLEAREPLPIVRHYVDLLRPEVDLMVVLTHQNKSAPMQTDKEADPEVQRGFHEDYEMAGLLRGVDVIFGGHSDNGLWQPVRHPATGTLVGITFGQGKYLGYLKLEVNTSTGEKSVKEAKLIPVESDKIPADPQVASLIEKRRAAVPTMTQVLGTINQMAIRRYYRESNLGNLVADMLREAANSDIAVINPGSLRADLNEGEVTTEELINVYPFIDKFQVKEITGEALHQLLEYSYEKTYGVAQLSGVETRYDPRKPIGQRLLEARVHGQPIDFSKKYAVASSSFLGNGGDGYSMLKSGKLLRESDEKMIDHLTAYFQKHRSVTVPALGRQVDVSKKP